VLTLNATDVRKDWGGFIDSVVRDKPKLIKRSRDYIVAISLAMLREILQIDKMHVQFMPETDGTISAAMDELGLTANAPDEVKVLKTLKRPLKLIKNISIEWFRWPSGFGY